VGEASLFAFKILVKGYSQQSWSLIDIPIYLDKITADGVMLSYARIFIKLNAFKPTLKFIDLQLEEDKVHVQI